jgi:hypothetical protein
MIGCPLDWCCSRDYGVGCYKQHEVNAMVDVFKKTEVVERGNDV